MICMSKKEAAALDIGDKVEILSYPEIVEAAEELDLITEEEKKEYSLTLSRNRAACGSRNKPHSCRVYFFYGIPLRKNRYYREERNTLFR